MENYKTLEITQKSPTSRVFNLHLNRPSLLNALSLDFFTEFPKALTSLDQNPNAAVIILSGNGDHFCSGIDLKALSSMSSGVQSTDRGRTAERLRRQIKFLQDAVTAIERCRKPVIAAIHGGCIGGGVDIITACDIRYCTESAFFSVKEVDLGITADLGTLQRLPGIVGYGKAVELALSGRRFSGSEAKELGLVSRVFGSKDALDDCVQAIAEEIAAKSPLAVTGTKKQQLLKARKGDLLFPSSDVVCLGPLCQPFHCRMTFGIWTAISSFRSWIPSELT
ncbi:hypothetical protein Vadar_031110 [Vaccinium darrowii]|uniref:Uncharacterized protein n=1 Tax=Vaccinium darrowii TaxID=229202 RepID=A0ACB7X550_9ERIC|nr:hypothetical protein Vadar_031110 [Vaccinium darrowii]